MARKKIDRQAVYDKYEGHCAYCGEHIPDIKQMQADHIIPLKEFPVTGNLPYHWDDIENLNPACKVCNKWKNAFSIETFRRMVSCQLENVRRFSANYRMCLKYRLVKETPHPILFYYEIIGDKKLIELAVDTHFEVSDLYRALYLPGKTNLVMNELENRRFKLEYLLSRFGEDEKIEYEKAVDYRTEMMKLQFTISDDID